MNTRLGSGKKAQTIAMENQKPVDATEVAEKMAIAVDQVWDIGVTKYKFDDNSVLAIRDVDVFGFDADDVESIRQYANWLGDESKSETAEIERLIEAAE